MTDSKKQTFMAFVRLAVMLVTAGLAMFGISVDADSLFTVVMVVVAVVAAILSWWKNNNVTDAATSAQKVLDELKAGLKPENEVATFEAEDKATDETTTE